MQLETSHVAGENFGQGNVAPIKVNGSPIVLRNSSINGINWGKGSVGSISVTGGEKFELENSSIFNTDVNSGNGVGTVTVTAESVVMKNRGSVSSRGNNQGNAGVTIAATNGSVEINDGSVTADRGNKPLNITATDSVSITNNSYIDTRSFNRGGAINITANSVLVDNSRIRSGDSRQGGGSITIDAVDSIKIANNSKLTSRTFGRGDSGDITLDADAISLLDSVIDSKTLDEGNAGQTKITANRFLADNSEILTTVGVDSDDRAVGNGGNINITTALFSAINGTALRSSTLREGNAGNVKITAPDGVLFSSGSSVFSEVEQTARGNGGNIDIITDSLSLNQNAQLSSSTSGLGKAGDINLITKTLTLESGGKVSATATETASQGKAGALTVNANSILLDNQGQIRADTTGGGGDVFVNSPLLVLRRGSSITTNASGENITGGNITIDGENGFIIALPWENSDIRADSQNFRGGNVTIKNTAGIYGIQSRKEPLPNSSDITAKGATPDLSGNIQVNPPELDPNNGLIELPVNLVDASNQISNACTPGGSQFDNEFVVTGRGGLPMSPTEILQETNTLSSFLGEIRNN